MQDINLNLQQLPNFIKSEIIAHAGSTNNLSTSQIIANYRRAAEQLIAAKRAGFYPVNPATDFYKGRQSSKEQLDSMVMSRAKKSPFKLLQSPMNNTEVAHITLESIRYLTTFNNQLAAIQAQLNEAARQLALRQAAEETARQHALEAARLRAQQQAAEESARQLARRQAEAQRQAEDTSLRLIRPRVEQAAITQLLELARKDVHNPQPDADSPLNLIPGPLALAEGKNAALQLETDIRSALADFANTIDQADGIPTTDGFKAMLHTFRQTGVDLQVISNGLAA